MKSLPVKSWWQNLKKWQKIVCAAIASIVVFGGVYCLLIFVVFRPTLTVGAFNLGRLRITDTESQLSKYLDAKQLTYQDVDEKTRIFSAKESGIFFEEKDLKATATTIKASARQRYLKPWANCCKVELPKLAIDAKTLNRVIAENLSIPDTDKETAELLFFDETNSFAAVADKNAGLTSRAAVADNILKAIQDTKSKNTVIKSTSSLTAEAAKSLTEARDAAERMIRHAVTIKLNETALELDKKTLSQLVVLTFSEGKYHLEVDASRIQAYLGTVAKDSLLDAVDEKYIIDNGAKKITVPGRNGIAIADAEKVANDIIAHLKSEQPTAKTYTLNLQPVQFKSINVTPAPPAARRSYTYRIYTLGSVQADLAVFRANVAATLSDARGWRGAGVSFREVANASDFDIVLTEPAVVGSYGGCGSYYSCRSGRLVLINDDRWRMATSVWTGSLRDYQHMVVNHEVGHWLGLGHASCPGTGQLAMVMQQQSIDLGGCVFNPWPTKADYNNLR
jgi:hypothetical protein